MTDFLKELPLMFKGHTLPTMRENPLYPTIFTIKIYNILLFSDKDTEKVNNTLSVITALYKSILKCFVQYISSMTFLLFYHRISENYRNMTLY